ncbi:MAG: UDP-N-acetylmuramate--L-alanine ligase [Coriobacteriia bacterium]|nr:UDP-N-acetylmuramate--L-alanine ligase [Coriobacteriia bacterium]
MHDSIRKIHFIGIGGVGMSGIARVAAEQGYTVSGSDLRKSRYTDQLEEAGVTVFVGQKADNILATTPDVVVISTAILENNPELMRARELGLPIWHRAKMLAHLGLGLETLAVAGTHGKTTTSSMLASTLDALGEDPTFLIGGIVRAYGSNAHCGKGKYYVVEADESDKSFTYLDPACVLVTNVEADHLDHYSGLDEIYSLFAEFMESVPEEGHCVVCGDDIKLAELARATGRKVTTYGFGSTCDTVVSNYVTSGVSTSFDLRLPDGTMVSAGVKQNPGRHNALNAAGVITLLWACGYDPQKVADALRGFAGVRRRFDLVGEAAGVTVVDDYGHHPTEIAATLAAAKALDFKHVHIVFQPHRYSRVKLFTEVLKDDFSQAFDDADTVTFMDVYPAGEMPVPGVNGSTFMQVVLDHEGHPRDTTYVERRQDLAQHVMERVCPGDLVLTMGAGDVTAMGPEILRALRERESQEQA